MAKKNMALTHKLNPAFYADMKAAKADMKADIDTLNTVIDTIGTATTAQIKAAIKDTAKIEKNIIKGLRVKG